MSIKCHQIYVYIDLRLSSSDQSLHKIPRMSDLYIHNKNTALVQFTVAKLIFSLSNLTEISLQFAAHCFDRNFWIFESIVLLKMISCCIENDQIHVFIVLKLSLPSLSLQKIPRMNDLYITKTWYCTFIFYCR